MKERAVLMICGLALLALAIFAPEALGRLLPLVPRMFVGAMGVILVLLYDRLRPIERKPKLPLPDETTPRERPGR